MTTDLSYADLTTSWPQFSHNISQFLDELGLTPLQLECDHVALRVNSAATATSLRHEFADKGEIISDNMINGRPILIIELDTPLHLGNMCIACVELPYPGSKQYSNEGWEHIELILPCEVSSCEALASQLIAAAPQLARVLANQSDIEVKMSSPQGEHERLANPTIAFKKQGVCIKVHPHGIKAVIDSERTGQ